MSGPGLSKAERNHLRRKLYDLQKGQCCYCARETFLYKRESVADASRRLGRTRSGVMDQMATLEHLRRQADGGGHHNDNLAMACAACNSQRGTRSWVEFKTLRSSASHTASPLVRGAAL